jgi:hypothetical protein
VDQGEENRTFPQATHRQGEGKTGHFLRLHTGRVRAKQEFPQATHRQGEGKSGQFARYSQAGCELPSGCFQGKEKVKGLSFFLVGWITFKFARFSWCDT